MYSFETFLDALLDDEQTAIEAKTAALHKGRGLDVLLSRADSPEALLAEALNDPQVSAFVLYHLTNRVIEFGQDRNFSTVLDIVTQFVHENAGSARLAEIGPQVMRALSQAPATVDSNDEAQVATEVRRFALMLAPYMEPTAAGRGAVLSAGYPRRSQIPADDRLEYGHAVMDAVDVEQVDPTRPTTHAMWATHIMVEIVQQTHDEALLRRLVNSPIRANVNIAPLVYAVPGTDGELGIDLLRSSDYDDEHLSAMFNRHRVTHSESRTAVALSVLADGNSPDYARMRALAYLAAYEPDRLNEYKVTVENLIATTVTNDGNDEGFAAPSYRDTRAVVVEARAALLNALSRMENHEWLPICYANSGKFSRTQDTSPVRIRSRIAGDVITILNTCLPGSRFAATSELVNAMFVAANAHPGDTHVPTFNVALAHSGLLAEQHLATLRASGLLGEDPVPVNGDAAVADRFRLTGDGVPAQIGDGSIREYMKSCTFNGLSTLAAVGLYCTDTRVPLDVRANARVDFMTMISEMPSQAETVPARVWSGLNRVRDGLPVSNDLAERLIELGGPAAKFGSKNLVKIAFV